MWKLPLGPRSRLLGLGAQLGVSDSAIGGGGTVGPADRCPSLPIWERDSCTCPQLVTVLASLSHCPEEWCHPVRILYHASPSNGTWRPYECHTHLCPGSRGHCHSPGLISCPHCPCSSQRVWDSLDQPRPRQQFCHAGPWRNGGADNPWVSADCSFVIN